MSAKTIDEQLAGVPLFAGLSTTDLRAVGSLATRGQVHSGAKLATRASPVGSS